MTSGIHEIRIRIVLTNGVIRASQMFLAFVCLTASEVRFRAAGMDDARIDVLTGGEVAAAENAVVILLTSYAPNRPTDVLRCNFPPCWDRYAWARRRGGCDDRAVDRNPLYGETKATVDGTIQPDGN